MIEKGVTVVHSAASPVRRYVDDLGVLKDDTQTVLSACGDIYQTLLCYELIFPDFQVVDDSVILKLNVDAESRFRDALRNTKWTREKIELSVNIIEIVYLFENYADVTDEIQERLACKLQYSWRCKLEKEFPKRQFIVEVYSAEESGSVWAVAFYERRDYPANNSAQG